MSEKENIAPVPKPTVPIAPPKPAVIPNAGAPKPPVSPPKTVALADASSTPKAASPAAPALPPVGTPT
ncbi:MAG: hypothetical protein K9M60_04205, partial [Akkermansiaceae bacterium]|nr:hypothetical protein [Akkermansiaceae bacterium]